MKANTMETFERETYKQFRIKTLLVVVFFVFSTFVPIPMTSAQEERKRGYKGAISKGEMLSRFMQDDSIRGYVIQGKDIIQIIKETDHAIIIEDSIIDGGLDFTQLPSESLGKDQLPRIWNEEEKEEFMRRFEKKGLSVHPEDIRVVDNDIVIVNSEIRSDKENRWSIVAENTVFYGPFDCNKSTLKSDALFTIATFYGEADFSEVTFSGIADFGGAAFYGISAFVEANFSGKTEFGTATFNHETYFYTAKFGDKVSFYDATFSGMTYFHDAAFGSEADFFEATFRHTPDFKRATFSGKASFSYAIFGSWADFSEANFITVAEFHEATFEDDACFSRVSFGDETSFRDVTFSGGADFQKAILSGEVDFSGAKFTGTAYFPGARFGGKANLFRATFIKEVNLSKAIFGDGASFREAEFRGEANFRNAAFGGEIYFGGAIFRNRTAFHMATFGGQAGFHEVTFSDEVDFFDVTFNDVTFFKATFGGEAVFIIANFKARAGFPEVIFSDEVFFEEAKFGDKVSFCDATFSDLASFERANFGGGVNFESAVFGGVVSFLKATFSGRTSFSKATYAKLAYFRDAVFYGPLVFRFSDIAEYADFRNATIEELDFNNSARPTILVGRIDFREAIISEAHFQNIIFEKDVDFSDVQFGVRGTDKKFSVVFRSITFESGAYFIRTDFAADTAFERINFKGDANFTDADLKGAKIEGKQKLSLSYLSFKNLLIGWEQLPNPESWVSEPEDRIKSFVDLREEQKKDKGKEVGTAAEKRLEPLSHVLKGLEASFRSRNQLSDANQAYYHMRNAELREERAGKAVWQWLPNQIASIIWGVTCGYGTRISRILAWCILFDLFFAVIYFLRGHLRSATKKDLSFKLRLFDFPMLYLGEDASGRKKHSMNEFIGAFRFSSVVLLKTGYRDTTISGNILGVNFKYLVWIEWLLGFYLLASLVVTLSNTVPLIHRLMTGVF